MRGPRPEAIPTVVGTACTLIGLLNVVSGVLPRFRRSRAHDVVQMLPGAVSPWAAAASLVIGVVLLMLAHGLKRRKRRAWIAAVGLLPVAAATQFLRHSLIGMVLSLALLALMIRHRGQFAALPDPRTRWKALVNFVLLGAVSMLLGLIVVAAHPDRVVGDPSLRQQTQHVLWGLFGFEGPVGYTGRADDTVAYSLGALGLLTITTTAYLAFRPERPRPPHSPPSTTAPVSTAGSGNSATRRAASRSTPPRCRRAGPAGRRGR